MLCRIIYFSCTGNTKRAAEQVQAGIRESGHQCELIEMREWTTDKIDPKPDIWGFMTPVFGWREPKKVGEFLQALPLMSGGKAFVGGTAGDQFGNTAKTLARIVKKRGLDPVGSIFIRAPPNYTPWNNPGKFNPDWDPAELEQAKKFGTQIFPCIESGKPLPGKIKFKLGGAILAGISAHNWTMRTLVGKLEINHDLCIKCNKCADNCAWGAITPASEAKYPEINFKKCGGCCACINLCPKEAIGNKKINKKVKYHAQGYAGFPAKKAT